MAACDVDSACGGLNAGPYGAGPVCCYNTRQDTVYSDTVSPRQLPFFSLCLSLRFGCGLLYCFSPLAADLQWPTAPPPAGNYLNSSGWLVTSAGKGRCVAVLKPGGVNVSNSLSMIHPDSLQLPRLHRPAATGPAAHVQQQSAVPGGRDCKPLPPTPVCDGPSIAFHRLSPWFCRQGRDHDKMLYCAMPGAGSTSGTCVSPSPATVFDPR